MKAIGQATFLASARVNSCPRWLSCLLYSPMSYTPPVTAKEDNFEEIHMLREYPSLFANGSRPPIARGRRPSHYRLSDAICRSSRAVQ
ncbi:hypothetical protein BJX61DRAFT_433099 [Aspergillus egyptiacus]|nr:hypothetical protein BJX61DRAFT_433099 [Aspergillus egyptiacus]